MRQTSSRSTVAVQCPAVSLIFTVHTFTSAWCRPGHVLIFRIINTFHDVMILKGFRITGPLFWGPPMELTGKVGIYFFSFMLVCTRFWTKSRVACDWRKHDIHMTSVYFRQPISSHFSFSVSWAQSWHRNTYFIKCVSIGIFFQLVWMPWDTMCFFKGLQRRGTYRRCT